MNNKISLLRTEIEHNQDTHKLRGYICEIQDDYIFIALNDDGDETILQINKTKLVNGDYELGSLIEIIIDRKTNQYLIKYNTHTYSDEELKKAQQKGKLIAKRIKTI